MCVCVCVCLGLRRVSGLRGQLFGCKAERLGWIQAALRLLRIRGRRVAVRRGAVRLKPLEDEQPGPCPGLGSTIGEGFLILTAGLGLGVVELPRLGL